MEIIAPPLVVASTAPYSAMLIRMKAETLPCPAGSLAASRSPPGVKARLTTPEASARRDSIGMPVPPSRKKTRPSEDPAASTVEPGR